MSSKSSRRGKRGKRRQGRGMTYMVGIGPQGQQTVSAIPRGQEGLLRTYIEAHALLPPTLLYGRMPSPKKLATALDALEKGEATGSDLLSAIVLLGHSPCPQALEALDRYGKSGRQHAGIAAIALMECADIYASLSPRQRQAS